MNRKIFKSLNGLWVASFIVLCSGYAFGHSLVISPNGGETLIAGDIYTIEYSILITHPFPNPFVDHFELSYSTVSNAGPFTAIDLNIIPPEPNAPAGTAYEYDWTVPSIIDSDVWVRVNMLAGDPQQPPFIEYPDVSDNSFSIICGYTLVGDVNGDCKYDLLDFAILASYWLSNCLANPSDPGCVVI